MMISTDTYFELYLKEKNENELLTIIRGLKNKIGHLKNIVEHPYYQMTSHPTEKVKIICFRAYLEKAIRTFKEQGYEYHHSKKELRAIKFQDNISYISKMTLEIGGFFEGFKRYGVVLENDEYKYFMENIMMPKAEIIKENIKASISKDEFFECIKSLYLGEWLSHYHLNRFKMAVMDGTQWRLQVEFSNDEPNFTITGDNCYPYNFDSLEELLMIEDV